MTDILSKLDVTVTCDQCGSFTTSAAVVAESQHQLEACLGSPDESPLALFAGLLDRAAIESLDNAWKALEGSAQQRGECISLRTEHTTGRRRHWDDATKEALRAHLASDHHDYVWARLPFLVPMVAKIARLSGTAPWTRLVVLVNRLHAVVLSHLDREEHMLARFDKESDKTLIDEQLATLRNEHDDIWHLLRQVCDAAEVLEPTVEALSTVVAFREELHRIQQHLRTQMQIEDDILSAP
tara:strand:+ start:43637 stop:44356 length:720 start_codon:yes stop_codon:yes gene_type:complete